MQIRPRDKAGGPTENERRLTWRFLPNGGRRRR
jgi:hypothetical protein